MTEPNGDAVVDRRGFLTRAGAGLAAAGVALTSREEASAQVLSERHKLDRIATNSWALRQVFKARGGGGRGRGTPPSGQAAATGGGGAPTGRGAGGANRALTSAQMKEKYGEITMMDFPQFTKDTFPGVTHLDIRSSLFGDVTDDSMYVPGGLFDPSSPSGQEMARGDSRENWPPPARASSTFRTTRRRTSPIRTVALRKAGVEIGKTMARRRRDHRRQVGADELPERIRPEHPSVRRVRDPATGYPKNDAIVPYLNSAIESYKEMADYGGEKGIRVTIENHWGLAADPANIRIILDAVNHPYCEATPDFCNWEYEHMLFSGLKILAPYAHTNCHAKFWDRWKNNDVQRSVRIMLAAGYKGTFALEYEEGPWDGVEGSRYLYKEVLAALSAPAPVI